MQSRQFPSLFCTNTIGLPQGDEMGWMCPLWSSSWICRLISSLSNRERRWTSPLGNGAPGVRSMGCLTSQCRGTPAGEAKISEYSSMTLSTCFCYVERSYAETLDLDVIFHLFSERITKKTKFPV
jgi:hypothetical protein